MKNDYEIRGDVTVIFIKSKTHGNFETLIDTSDLEKVKEGFSWYIYRHHNGEFYVNGNINKDGKRTFTSLHRYILDLTGFGTHADHVHHNTLDNRRKFLNAVSCAENLQNQRKNSSNTSGVTGVHFRKGSNNWYSKIRVNGHLKHLGTFENFEQAKQARLLAEKKYFHYKSSLEGALT